MLRQRATLVAFLLFLADQAVTVAAFVAAYLLRTGALQM